MPPLHPSLLSCQNYILCFTFNYFLTNIIGSKYINTFDGTFCILCKRHGTLVNGASKCCVLLLLLSLSLLSKYKAFFDNVAKHACPTWLQNYDISCKN